VDFSPIPGLLELLLQRLQLTFTLIQHGLQNSEVHSQR
jgi:hypothetical protein